MLHVEVERIIDRLDSEADKLLIANLLKVAEEAKNLVESGSGTYPLMKAVLKVYEPEVINLYLWTK